MTHVNSKEFKLDLSFVENHSYDKNDVFFEMNSLTGELGELANVIKKESFYHVFPDYKKKVDAQVLDGRPDFYEQTVDEAGDVFFYFIKVLNKLNVSIEDVIEYQKNKLLALTSNIGVHWKK